MSKEIYLVFSYTGTLLSKCIKKITNDKYAHVSISLDDTFTNMYSFGRKHPSNPIWAGLVTENLFDGVFKNFKNSKCLIYKIEISPEQYLELEKILNIFMSEQKKYKYNFIGLFTVKTKKTFKRKYHYFCSQFVSEVLQAAHIIQLSKSPEFIKPCDLLNTNIENKIFIYEGLITDFKK